LLIDHIIYAHPDLDAAVSAIEDRFGVRAAGGGQHPGRGTHNKVLGLGPQTYLEIIAPDPTQSEPSEPRPYGVEGITRGQLVGWALACEDIEKAVARARSRGFDPGEAVDGQRVSPTGTLLQWRVSRNAQTGGLVPFLINWGETSHPAVDAAPGLVLLSVHLEHPEPGLLTTALEAVGADVDVHQASKPALVARIGGPRGEQELR
jgi:hypothetical protein